MTVSLPPPKEEGLVEDTLGHTIKHISKDRRQVRRHSGKGIHHVFGVRELTSVVVGRHLEKDAELGLQEPLPSEIRRLGDEARVSLKVGAPVLAPKESRIAPQEVDFLKLDGATG